MNCLDSCVCLCYVSILHVHGVLFFFHFKESAGMFKGMFKKNTRLLDASTQSEVRNNLLLAACFMLRRKNANKNPDNCDLFVFQLQDDLSSLGSTDSLPVNGKVRFGKALLDDEQVWFWFFFLTSLHVFQEAGGMFTGLFKKKKSRGAETGSQVAATNKGKSR